jgi:hypothetical protein
MSAAFANTRVVPFMLTPNESVALEVKMDTLGRFGEQAQQVTVIAARKVAAL